MGRAGILRSIAPQVALAGLVGISFYWNLWAVPLFDVDEGAFSEATREMLASGDFISTTLNGEPRYDKPILIYWLQAAAVALFGVTEWAFRLPSAIAATLWVVVVYRLARELWDTATAWHAAALTALVVGVSLIGKAATADALLNLWLVLTLADIYRYQRDGRAGQLHRVYLWMGLGLLTKGPVAVLIPLAVSLWVAAVEGRWRTWLTAVIAPRGWLILLLVAAPWYAAQLWREGWAFVEGFLLVHNVSRFADPMEGHSGQWFYYLVAVPLLVLPFTAFLWPVLRRGRAIAADPAERFLALWFLFVLGFFTLADTKLPHYILYGLTPVLLLMARYRHAWGRAGWALVPVFVWWGVFAGLPGLAGVIQPWVDTEVQDLLARREAAFGVGYGVLVGLGGLVILVLAFLRHSAWTRTLAAAAVLMGLFNGAVVPAVGTLQQGPIQAAGEYARHHIDPATPVVMWRQQTPSFSVYRQAVTPRRRPRVHEVVLTHRRHLDEILPVAVLYQQGGVVLARRLSPNASVSRAIVARGTGF